MVDTFRGSNVWPFIASASASTTGAAGDHRRDLVKRLAVLAAALTGAEQISSRARRSAIVCFPEGEAGAHQFGDQLSDYSDGEPGAGTA